MSTTGYSRSPRLLKGALIYFGAPMLIPLPNIIVFQYNPESMTRTLKPFQANDNGAGEGSGQRGQGARSLSQPCDPQESFSLALELDASDALERPESHPVAMVSGIADRLAAIEMLMYPPEENGGLLSGIASLSVSASGGGFSLGGGASSAMDTKPRRVPIVLFFWGPGRIVPVRVTSLSIEEQQYAPTLYPLRAKATIGLDVLSLEDLKTLEGDPSSAAVLEIAKGCYTFTRTQKKLLATANLANSVESIAGMLPI